MADKSATPTKPPPTTTTTVGATTTREQHRRNNAEQDTIDDDDRHSGETTKTNKDVPKEIFKGKIEKMNGHVFQLSEEGRKGNQYTQTLEALASYASIELDHAKDLSPLFETLCAAAKIVEPDDQPPMSSNKTTRVTRDHRLYIAWKFECESYNTRVVALKANQLKLFTVMLLQCSQSVKNTLEGSTGYETAKAGHDCKWLTLSRPSRKPFP